MGEADFLLSKNDPPTDPFHERENAEILPSWRLFFRKAANRARRAGECACDDLFNADYRFGSKSRYHDAVDNNHQKSRKTMSTARKNPDNPASLQRTGSNAGGDDENIFREIRIYFANIHRVTTGVAWRGV